MATGWGDDHDPFAGLTLDDDFVRGAKVHEASAEARVERLRRIDAEYQRLIDDRRAQVEAAERASRRQHRGPRRIGALVAVVLAALVGWSVLYENDGTPTGGVLDQQPEQAEQPEQAGDAPDLIGEEADTQWPSPSAEHADEPLGTPAPLAEESSAYRFSQIQPISAEPVAYDPCRPIHVVHNDRDAPPGADALIAEALDDVSHATGLQYTFEGSTDEPPDLERPAFQPDRYGDRWAPVLIAWSDPTVVSELEGRTVGLGGSSWVTIDESQSVYVSGVVVLDAPELGEMAGQPHGGDQVTATIRHELAHVVGLDHVDDATELMHPVASGVVSFGPGDLAGLAELGRGDCFPGI